MFRQIYLGSFWLIVLPLLVACSDDEATNGSFGASYLVASGVITPDGVTGFIFGLDSIAEGTVPDLENAIEFPGGAFVFDIPQTPSFLVVGQTEPATVRFDLAEDGTPELGPTVSLAGVGVRPGIRVVLVVDATSAWVSVPGGQIVEINPTDMTIRQEIVVEGFVRDDIGEADSEPSGRAFQAGDSLFFTYGWFDDARELIVDEVGLIHVDMSSGTASASFLSGCGVLGDGMVAADGAVWLASWGFTAAARAFSDESAPACLLRLPPGATSLDDAEVLDFETLAGGPAGGLLPVGPSTGLIRVADASLDRSVDTSDELASQAAWG